MTNEHIFALVDARPETISTAYTKVAEELGIDRGRVVDAYLSIANARFTAKWGK